MLAHVAQVQRGMGSMSRVRSGAYGPDQDCAPLKGVSLLRTETVASAVRPPPHTPRPSHLTDAIRCGAARRVSHSLHKCSLDAAELEKMQSNLRTYKQQSLSRHVGEPRQVQLMCDSHRLGRTVAVLGENQVRLTTTRIVALESVWPMQQDDHICVLLKAVMH
jgi:hypothetical protein